MIRGFALGLLFALSACNRHGVADVTLDADAAQRNATAGKTLADLAAADAASQGPAPVLHDDKPVPPTVAAPESAPRDDADQTPDPADDSQSND